MGRLAKVQVTWNNTPLEILGVYAPYVGHTDALDFWEKAKDLYTPSYTAILAGDYNVPIFKPQHPAFERSATLRDSLKTTLEEWDLLVVESRAPTHFQNGISMAIGGVRSPASPINPLKHT
ncbi:hypothetical protein Pelo_8266 [Pelomyxa schiedti]|nr:hypothetical protein Pelo_8266 [Pelomyxa schiedti]